MKIRIPYLNPSPSPLEDAGRPESDVVRRVTEELRRKEVVFTPADPKGLAAGFRLPNDITRVPSREIANLMSRCVSYRAYLNEQIALREVERLRVQRMLDYRKAEIRGQAEGKKWETDAACLLDPEVCKAQEEIDVHTGVIDGMAAVSEGIGEKYSVLSREMTRRLGEQEQTR